MTMKRLIRVSVPVAVALLVVVPGTAWADSPPPARVTSHYELSSGNKLGRDCGFSVVSPLSAGEAFWFFCDTAIFDPAENLIGFIGGTTAARGPFTAGSVPGGLTEIPSPPNPLGAAPSNRGPALFLPVPSGLLLPDGVTPCGAAGSNSYAASWLSGAAGGPDRTISGYNGRDLIMLSYVDVCVRGTFEWTVQAFGVSWYHPATNRFVQHRRIFGPSLTELPWQRQLGSPIFNSDGYLYFHASHCDNSGFGACGSGRTLLARTPWQASAGWGQAGSYRYRTQTGWTSDPNAAVSVMPGAKPFGVDVRRYPGVGFAAIEQTSIGGHYRVWRASSVTGPWTAGPEQLIPGCESSAESWCYAYAGHPELSTADRLLMSYYDPDHHHVLVMQTAWPPL